MFDLINPIIENYCCNHSEQESELLEEITRYTHLNTLNPRMLSGRIQGRLLSLLSKLKRPVNALEIGTFTGYSTICIAEGIAGRGILNTIEVNEENAFIAQRFFSKSSYSSKIRLHVGNALQIIPRLKFPFDFVFIDADKKNYINYFNLVADKLEKGGILVIDNVLWSGKVIDEKSNDVETTIIREFNLILKNDKRFRVLMLPLRDGLTLALKN